MLQILGTGQRGDCFNRGRRAFDIAKGVECESFGEKERGRITRVLIADDRRIFVASE
jgi:hypothetical protein